MNKVYIITNQATDRSLTLDQLNDIKDVDVVIIMERTPYFNLFKQRFLVFCMEDHFLIPNVKSLIMARLIAEYIKITKITTQEELNTKVVDFIQTQPKYKYYSLKETENPIEIKENSYPSNVIETYAYYTKSIVYIVEHDGYYLICPKGQTIEKRENIRLFLSKGIFNRNFKVDYKYTDKLLRIIDKIKEVRFLAPHKDWKMVNTKEVKESLINIIRRLINSHPKKIGKYYNLNDDLITCYRNEECILFKKYVLYNGRDVSITINYRYLFLDRKKYESLLNTFFRGCGITNLVSWDRAMEILLNFNTKRMNHFTTLISRRMTWIKVNKPRRIEQLTEEFIKMRLIQEMDRYIKPNLVDIIIYSYEQYNLTNIISKLHPNSREYYLLKNDNDELNDHFIEVLFDRGNILDNYRKFLGERKFPILSAKEIQAVMFIQD